MKSLRGAAFGIVLGIFFGELAFGWQPWHVAGLVLAWMLWWAAWQ